MYEEPLTGVVEGCKLVEALNVSDARHGHLGYGRSRRGLGEDSVEFLHSPVGGDTVVVDEDC